MRTFRRYLTTALLYICCATAGVMAALPYTFVGGPAGNGAAITGYNPVVSAGVDASSNVQYTQCSQVITLLPSAARTAQTTTSNMQSYNCKSIILYLNVTTASGTGGLTVFLGGVDPISGSTKYLNATPTAVTATGLNVYIFTPGATGINGALQATQMPIPAVWNVQVRVGDASSYTYSLGAHESP